MKKKIVYLIVIALLFTSVFSFVGNDTVKVAAAPYINNIGILNATVTANSLNVRQGPSTKYSVVCVLKKGQALKVFGTVGDWYAIYEPAKGCVGVVSGKYIKIAWPSTKTPTPTPKPTPTPTPAPTPTPSAPPSGVSTDEQAMLNLVNKARADAGMGPLKFDTTLQKVARLKAQDMVNKNYFSHQSPTYGSPFDMMKQFGVTFNTAGENIAGNQTVNAAFNAWMNSPGHKANILNSKYNYTGIGIVDSPTYGKMFVQEFIGR